MFVFFPSSRSHLLLLLTCFMLYLFAFLLVLFLVLLYRCMQVFFFFLASRLLFLLLLARTCRCVIDLFVFLPWDWPTLSLSGMI